MLRARSVHWIKNILGDIDPRKVELEFRNGDKETQDFLSTYEETADLVKEIKQKLIMKDQLDRLFDAVWWGSIPQVESLLRDEKISPNQLDITTPITEAAKNNQIDKVKLLVEYKADVNLGHSQLPLIAAVQHRYLNISEVLIEAKANLELKACEEKTALDLMILDADSVANNKDAETAAHHDEGLLPIINLLLKHRAKVHYSAPLFKMLERCHKQHPNDPSIVESLECLRDQLIARGVKESAPESKPKKLFNYFKPFYPDFPRNDADVLQAANVFLRNLTEKKKQKP